MLMTVRTCFSFSRFTPVINNSTCVFHYQRCYQKTPVNYPKFHSHNFFQQASGPTDAVPETLLADPVADLLDEVLCIQPEQYLEVICKHGGTALEAKDVSAALSVLMSLCSRERVKQLILSHPELLKLGFELPGWLDFLTSYGVRSSDFLKLLSTNTTLFTMGSLYNAGLVIMELMRLGLTHRDLSSSIVPKCASVLGLDVEGDIKPTLLWLEHELKVEQQAQRAALLTKCPQILTRPVRSVLPDRISYLEGLGLSREQVRDITLEVTSLLILDPEPQVKPAMVFLTQTCALQMKEAVQVAISCPQVFCLSLKNLQRKWDFLNTVIQPNSNSEAILAYPSYFSLSLLNEIGPRVQFMQLRHSKASKGQVQGISTLPAFSSISGLELLLSCSVQDYCSMLGVVPEEYMLFRYKWQVTDGTAWSGMITVVPYLSGESSW
ncbi:hypothetical protein CEUSTIGMA_g6048.t1 [Chlamydomonas eustigma]|uniref:mTERF domain-containing protein, mitochondrial n=1 Tax=Chlamydomonas eustigma TaxID=1157962 RepID=A0A250X6R7_9CHLO|nr:hypothetical protein CEUSTIGMA_g6048.t1 [Chlamydomonas eustigma]|eukprot:GAX78609.1 hypothetical protein CEUSTIGMA_g6048.t1 [Chlamydomonas eustigma]